MTTIRTATDDDLPRILALLTQSSLPTADLVDAVATFLVDERDGALAGVIGLQRFGQAGLLRSLAVAPAYQGQGIARRLVAALETEARQQDIDALYLLTQTAERFFTLQAFEALPRDQAPAGLQASAEFRSLCPASAVCMRKRLSAVAPR
ncbi:arsenic resistance N-acetyltransferase ArsN2 [Pseudoxanthomonas sp. LH2527]|uniref:arsenic resistance N-acetyltransferase ArsN2 n=1 Tax=Pseudoxanthomonas sp. LH2527 TaxID=2923249 RepID=UPI001F12ECBB|nr:arsenic resistance N-acetyltransferase ArsN2 [Pseudoxanthomonas sp. LH2527]MCH6483838.1 arsenic resistance N-acetyltransferase ArsN2 [Pseudoxanthomonas sp. LH2527]